MEKNTNILYIDDETNNLEVFKASFRRDFNVFTAATPSDGFKILKENEIHIIIADQRMPELTGVQFFESIIPEYPDIVRILLTGYSDIDAVIEAINAGRIFRYMKKPLVFDEVKLILQDAAKIYFLGKQNQVLLRKLHNDVLTEHRTINLLKKYIPEDVINEIFNKEVEEKLKSEGEYRVVSVLFAEISGFGRLLESTDINESIELLKTYFSLMDNCINKHKGYLNKFLGGGVMAIFGAPISAIDNPLNAVLCGLEMIEKIGELNKKMGYELSLSIGIHIGEGMIGKIESEDRVEYSIFGKIPKIAHHIVKLAKTQTNKVFISDSIYEQTKKFIFVTEETPRVAHLDDQEIKYYILDSAKIKTLF